MNRVLTMAMGLTLTVGVLLSCTAAFAEGLNGRDTALECNFYVPNFTPEKLAEFRQAMGTQTNTNQNVLTVVNQCTRRAERLSVDTINVTEGTGDMRIEGMVQDWTGPETAKRQIDIIK